MGEPLIDFISRISDELSDGDKFLKEELRVEMACIAQKYDGIPDGTDKAMPYIVRARAEGYMAGRNKRRGIRSDGFDGDTMILKAELQISEARVDFLEFQKDNLEKVIGVWQEAAEYWKNLWKEK